MSIDFFSHAAGSLPRQVTLLPELAAYWEKYTGGRGQGAMQPLRVSAELASAVGGYHPVTLDGLLAWCVVNEAMQGNQLDNSGTPYLLPVPLGLRWRSPSGMPLWAANALEPVGAQTKTTVYWHKRAAKPEHVNPVPGVPKASISAVMGRYKEKRIPMPAVVTPAVSATCVGDQDEIARLLAGVDAIGKKRHAIVTRWIIEPVDAFEFSRYIPAVYTHGKTGVIPLDIQIAAWTPPYWDGVPECKAYCHIPHRGSSAL